MGSPPGTSAKGLLSHLPPSLVPYAELVRLHKPAGTLYVYFPYLFGALFAAGAKHDAPPPGPFLSSNLLLLVVAFIVRCIGCTWNDYVDRELDKHVERCRLRPLARGAISVSDALLFMLAQYGLLFSVVGMTARETLPYLVPIVVSGTLYPYAKRVTHYAQLVLGVSLSMGTLIGCSALGVDPLGLLCGGMTPHGVALAALVSSYVVWTMIYDTIYAFQDIESDKKIGNMAMSIRFERHMKALLNGLAAAQTALLLTVIWNLEAPVASHVCVVVMGALLFTMASKVELGSPEECCWWFEKGNVLIGASLAASLAIVYFSRVLPYGLQ